MLDILLKTLTGDFEANDTIGTILRNQKETSPKEITQFYLEKINDTNSYVQNMLGVIYYNGANVIEDMAKAFKLYNLSACKGNSFGQYNLGMLYIKGLGINVNVKQGLKWYYLSAKQGNLYGQCAVGHAYYEGRIVKRDYDKAFKWFKLSAEQGYIIAQTYMGELYHYGYGVTEDLNEAYKWYILSALAGEQESIQRLANAEFTSLLINDLKTSNENNKQQIKTNDTLKEFIEHIKYHPNGINFKDIEKDFYEKASV